MPPPAVLKSCPREVRPGRRVRCCAGERPRRIEGQKLCGAHPQLSAWADDEGTDVSRRQISVIVTEQQRHYIKEKASSYGVTISSLVRHAIEAYTRTFDEIPQEGELVAVNYAMWLRCESLLADIEQMLRETSLQLAGTRRILMALERAGLADADDVRRGVEAIVACHGDVTAMRQELEDVRDAHDAACTAILALDNFISVGEHAPSGAPDARR